MPKKIGYVLSAFIIFIAIIVATSRMLIPIGDKHKADFEALASNLLMMPVTIKQVRVSWYQYQPEISLNDVTILNKETRDPVLHIQQVKVFFSIPQSLWHWKIVPSGIMVSGTDVNLYEKPNGEIALQGFSSLGGFNDQPYKSETKFTDVLGWLSQQPRLSLHDIDLRYTDSKGNKRFLTLYNLGFKNSGSDHIIQGKVLLHQDIPTEVTTTIQWSGDNADLNKIHANIYLFVSGFSLSQWLKGYVWQGWQLNSGMANAKIWATWNDGALQKIQCRFESYGLDLYSVTDKSSHKVSRLSGDVGWKKEGKNQVFAGDDIFIDLPSHLWPSTSFYLTLTPDAKGKLLPTALNIGYVNLTDAQMFLASSPEVLSDSMRKILSELKLTGDIQSLSAVFSSTLTDWKHISLDANVSRLSVLPWQHFPGVKNLSGVIKWNGKQGDFALHSNQTILQYDSVFSNPITIDQLTGNLLWEMDSADNWIIRLQTIQALNSDAAINTSGSLTVPQKGLISTDLSANFTVQRANHITRYLPLRVFDPGLVKWLQNAFLSGSVESGKAILKGHWNDFPFDKSTTTENSGQFLVSSMLKNLNLRFAPDWPQLKNLTGKLVFSGRQMTVDVDHAEITGIPVAHVHGEIPSLGGGTKEPTLYVQSNDVDADFSQGLAFVHASPLEKTIGKMFAGTKITGPIKLKLNLTVPLEHPENTTVLGDINFKDSELDLIPWNLKINQLQGQLQFTEKATTANEIKGRLFNKPFTLSLQTLQKTKTVSIVRALITNNIDIVDVEDWLKMSFSQVAKGSTNIAATIDFSLIEPLQVHLTSNLQGIAIDLPDQYAKQAAETRDFSADIIVQEKQPLRMKMHYGDLLGAALILERENEKFNLSGANLRLGDGSPAWPESSGLYVTGKIKELNWDKIKNYTSQSEQTSSAKIKLRAIDIMVEKLLLPGQELAQTRLEVEPTDNYWNLTITNSDINGEVQIPVKFTPESVITAQFQKLNLLPVSTDQPITKFDMKTLPSISFTANNFSYKDMQFGQVSFKTEPSDDGLIIQSLTVLSPRLELKSDGDWTESGTHLKGTATSSNVSGLLSGLGFDVHNLVSSKGRLDFDLSWRTAPYELTLATMNGQAGLDLGQGRIVELSQTSGAKMDLGRMLSIFSLQTIPRRLSLDFSDVFQKGYSFDSFKGDFKFENGNAYTTNTHFDGPVARVDIHGRIGLALKDYDFTLSVTPYVTSSIPVAATLLTGQPVIGLAAWAVDKVISSGVSDATTYYYVVRGPWSNPSWDSVSAPKKQL